MWQWIACLAIWFMEGSFFPQLIHLYRVKSAKEISLLFPMLNLTGRILIMLYMYSRGELVLALGFIVGITLRLTFFLQVLYYKWRQWCITHLKPSSV